MALRRMFSLSVIDTDKFNDMSVSARLLYYELSMRADDDGFVASPKKIVKMVGCSEDDMNLLISKGYVICFESGVVVITHWKMHNYIQTDRYRKTIYKNEISKLKLENNVYSFVDVSDLYTKCIQDVSIMDTQDRLDKNRLKLKLELERDKENSEISSTCVDTRSSFDYQSVVNSFNSICVSLPSVKKLTDKRKKAIKKAYVVLNEISFEEIFTKVENSDFLTGRNGKWNGCGFDWVLNTSNLTKILEGNYNNTDNVKVKIRNYEEEF